MTIEKALESKAWPFVEARKILKHIDAKVPEKGYVLFETGYGPSGLPHIGTFAEVARTTMVRNAFEYLTDKKIPTKLFCVSDDMDALRKVPQNLPNQEMLAENLGRPLCEIPDPFGKAKSFGDYMNSRLREFLDRFGFDYEFISAAAQYREGKFDDTLLKLLENYETIMDIMLPTLGPERRKTYSPFLPICEQTGKVLQVKIDEINKENGEISFTHPDTGKLCTSPVTKGRCKLQWKPDFGMRWAHFGVDYEMYGKDHLPNAKIYSSICKALGKRPPQQFFYELFLDRNGEKISKSKGTDIDIDQWLEFAPLESLSLFIYQNPSRAKKLYFETIPKNVDEYLIFNKKYHEKQEIDIENPLFHIHGGNVAKAENANISFALLLNLAAVCDPKDKAVLWGFIRQYGPGTNPENAPYLDILTDCTIKYYNKYIKPKKSYLAPNQEQKILLGKLSDMLKNIHQDASAQEIQNKIYDIGMESSYDNLKQYFSDLYQILLGQTTGPRLGSFFKLYGIKNTVELIKKNLKNT